MIRYAKLVMFMIRACLFELEKLKQSLREEVTIDTYIYILFYIYHFVSSG